MPLATVTILELSTGASEHEGVGAECRVCGLVAVKGFAEPSLGKENGQDPERRAGDQSGISAA